MEMKRRAAVLSPSILRPVSFLEPDFAKLSDFGAGYAKDCFCQEGAENKLPHEPLLIRTGIRNRRTLQWAQDPGG